MLGINLETVRFAAPEYLWLLIAPGVLLIGWFWQLAARRQILAPQLAQACKPGPELQAAPRKAPAAVQD